MKKNYLAGLIFLIFIVSLVSAGWTYNGKNYLWEEGKGVAKGNSYSVGGAGTVVADQAKLTEQGGIKTLTIGKGGYIEIKGVKYEIDAEKESKFVFDEKGNIVEGTKFLAGADTKYLLAGHEIELKKGTEILYEKDKIVLNMPDGSEVKIPEKKEEGEAEFEFRSEGKLKVNGKEFSSSVKGEGIFYSTKEKQFYVIDKGSVPDAKASELKPRFQLGGIGIGGIVVPPSPIKTYLFFDGERHTEYSDYVSVSESKLILSSAGDSSPVQIFPGSFGIKPGENILVQAVKGSVEIKVENGKTKMDGYGSYISFLGKNMIKYDGKDVKLVENILIGGEALKGSSPKIDIKSYSAEGQKADAEIYIRNNLIAVDQNGKVSFIGVSDEGKKLLNMVSKKETARTAEGDNKQADPQTVPETYQQFYDSVGSSQLKSGIQVYNPENLAKKDQKIYIKFGADWCAPCRTVDSKIRSVVRGGSGVTFVTVNVDKQGALARQLGYSGGGIPQSVTYQNGERLSDGSGWHLNYFR